MRVYRVKATLDRPAKTVLRVDEVRTHAPNADSVATMKIRDISNLYGRNVIEMIIINSKA